MSRHNIYKGRNRKISAFFLHLSEIMLKFAAEQNKEREYFKTQPVLKAWLFGSFARGEETPESDVDILVEYDKNARVSLLTISRMMGELEKSTGRRVDLIEEGCLLPFAVDSANHDKKMIYERKD